MAIDFSYIDHDILGDVADAIRFVEGSTADIAPTDYPQRIRALDKYIPDYNVLNFYMPNGGTIRLNKTGNPPVVELEYWLDENRQWLIWQPNSNGNRSITLSVGQKVYIRNTSESGTGFSTSSYNFYRFAFTDNVYAYGNTDSLLCKYPKNAFLTEYCYYSLFFNCELISAPKFPNLTLVSNCYRAMFESCTSLVIAPELPATTLSPFCYRYMFGSCTSLQKAPILPAKTVEIDSYESMFDGCTSLNYIETYMTDISATNCLLRWLYSVSPTGDFYCPASLTIPTGASGIPSGWTRHDLT